jgi:hypothetical protein
VTQAGAPAVLVEGEQRRRIVSIEDRWRIDDEWWRDPISRTYYRVRLDDGSVRTLYHDLVADAWYAQTY